jgi:hypothetical protein
MCPVWPWDWVAAQWGSVQEQSRRKQVMGRQNLQTGTRTLPLSEHFNTEN